MKNKAKIIGVMVFCVAIGSEALTLGGIRGAALIGRPLDVSVPVQVDVGEDASSLCFDAEVFHADTRQESSRVRVVTETAAQAQMANVRILSAAVIDEPVVTVYLRTGCGQKTTRRYVLLADIPSEVAMPVAFSPLASSASQAAPAASPQVDLSTARPAPVVGEKTSRAPRPAARRRIDSKRPEAKATVVPVNGTSAGEGAQAARSAGRSRLKLDTLESLASPIAFPPSAAPSAPVTDTLHEMRRIQSLEGEVKALLALAAKNEASLADLRARLQKTEAERFPDGLVYGLAALLLASLALAAVLWYRQRHARAGGEEWWSGSIIPPEHGSGAAGMQTGVRPSNKAYPAATPDAGNSVQDSNPSSDVDVSMIEMSESRFNNFLQAGATHNAVRGPSPSASIPVRPASVPAGVSLEAVRPSRALDLDLSTVGAQRRPASDPAPAADDDVPLPMPVAPRLDEPSVTAETSGGRGNLIDFDTALPDLAQVTPADKKPE